MPRQLFVCITIVAAIAWLPPAAPPIWAATETAPVSAGVAEVARSLGLDLARDRARFLAELARLLYSPPPGRSGDFESVLRDEARGRRPPASAAAITVPVPLSLEVWNRVIFNRTVRADTLVPAILADRRAALVAYTLAALDDETLAYIGEHAAVLQRLYEHDFVAFGAFGATLKIREDRIEVPGGEPAAALWEGILGASVRQPELFIRALYGDYGGRLAYLYDTIAQLDEPRAAFALGLWLDPAQRGARFTALAQAAINGYPEWRLDTLPFSRPLHDLAILLMRMTVEPTGAPAGLASAGFWADVFESQTLPGDRDTLRESPQDRPLDAAWLAEATDPGHSFTRGERFDQFAFGQRVFGDALPSTWSDVLVAVRAFPRQRVLLLTLERIGVRAPATYATIARQTIRHTATDSQRSFWTLAQLQGAVALVSTMTRGRSIDVRAAEALLLAAVRVPVDNERYGGRFLRWIENELVPLLPAGDAGGSVEGRIIAALAGRPAGRAAPRIEWEGEQYRVDLAAAERERLRIVREKQGGYTVDLALAIDRVTRALAAPRLTPEAMQAAANSLDAIREEFGPNLRRSPSTVLPPGVDRPRDAQEAIDRAAEELARAISGRDPRRAARAAAPLGEIVDVVLGDALLSLAYAADIGDPDGTALLGSNVALRHDFGFRYRDGDVRLRSYWAIPRQDFLPGVPWHIAGSAIGLDIGLAPLALRRMDLDRGVDMPLLHSPEREAFAVSAVLVDGRAVTDASRDAIATAIAAGRRRIEALAAGKEPLDAVAAAIALDGWRRRAASWLVEHEPARLAELFSLTELLILGGATLGPDLDSWGTSALHLHGCVCTRLIPTSWWRLLAGRPQHGLMASLVADVNLRIAEALANLRLPAALASHVLAFAVQDFIDEVAPTDPNDWLALTRSAQRLSRIKIEDYVAAAAAVGGPLVPVDDPSAGDRRP